METNDALPLDALLDAAPDGVIVCDLGGTISQINAQAERMFGYDPTELRGRRIDLLIPEESRKKHEGHLMAYGKSPRVRAMGSGRDLRGLRKDGSEFDVEISLSPCRSGDRSFIIAIIRDVTDRNALELSHKRANALLVSAVEAVQDAFVVYDESDRVLTTNRAALQLFRCTTAHEIVGTSFTDLLRGALIAGVFDCTEETADSILGRWVTYHNEPDGVFSIRTTTGRYLRVTDRRTADHGMVSTIADITNDMLHTAELEASRQAAVAANAAKSEFLSLMSHELRTPLNAILGFAQLLESDRKHPLDAHQLERLGYVLRGGEHLLRLVDDILDLSRIEAGRLSIFSESVDVAKVVDEVAHSLGPIAARAKIQIVTESALPKAVHVVADRTRLVQILMNFGSNAIKYGKPNGRVILRIAAMPNAVRIAVADDGIGIHEDATSKIFEPFERAGQEVGAIEGTGIGLAISKRLAELMGAPIDFKTQVGRGSEFWIDVPIDSSPRDETVRSEASTQAARPSRRVVVYVEDNPSKIALMREVVRDAGGAELLTAATAELGLELIRSHKPQLAIIDMDLSGEHGFAAVARLREWPETRNIPVIGIAAAGQKADRLRAENAGFDRYLAKPGVAELFQAVAEIVAGCNPVDQPRDFFAS